MISNSSHAETSANRNLQVTTKHEVLQALLGPTNLQQQKTVKVEEEGIMKQKHHMQTNETNYLQVISDEKVIKESSQAPQNKTLKIFHQNIRGLGNKTNEMYCHLHHDFPYILGISEHRLRESELQLTLLANYSLGPTTVGKLFLKEVFTET